MHCILHKCRVHASSARLVHPDGQGTYPLQFQACLHVYELISKLTGNEDYKISKGHETDVCYWYSHPQCYTNMTQSQGQCIIYVEYKDDISTLPLQKQVKIEGYTC